MKKIKIYNSNISQKLSNIDFIKNNPKDIALLLSEEISRDSKKAIKDDCSIYYSNTLIQLYNSFPKIYITKYVDKILHFLKKNILEISKSNDLLFVLGFKDSSSRDGVLCICNSSIILETTDFSDSTIKLAFSCHEKFEVSFTHISTLLPYSYLYSNSAIVFVIGNISGGQVAARDLFDLFKSVSKNYVLSLFFTQEKSYISCDDYVYDNINVSCNYYDRELDYKNIADIQAIEHYKKLFLSFQSSSEHSEESCTCSDDGCDCGGENHSCSCGNSEHDNNGFGCSGEGDEGCSCSCEGGDSLKIKPAAKSIISENELPLCQMEEGNLIKLFELSAINLANKIRMTKAKKLILGLSGGIDSTCALLVCLNAVKELKFNNTDIICVSMPSFGSSKCTQENIAGLVSFYKTDFLNIPISDTVLSHFDDIGHDKDIHTKVFENAQARIRALTLFDLANKFGGLQIGTSDLSESILGWCTFQGDQSAMFNANLSFSKTQLKYILQHYAKTQKADVLKRILETPISPELLPPDADGKISQLSEDTTGPYEMVDSFIYYYFYKGYQISDCIEQIKVNFQKKYSAENIDKWCQHAQKSYYLSSFKRITSMPGPSLTMISKVIGKFGEGSAFPSV